MVYLKLLGYKISFSLLIAAIYVLTTSILHNLVKTVDLQYYSNHENIDHIQKLS